MIDIVEVRCPIGPQRLFTKLRLDAATVRYVDGNLIEFPCSDCRRRDPENLSVFHRYNFLGELVQTVRLPRS